MVVIELIFVLVHMYKKKKKTTITKIELVLHCKYVISGLYINNNNIIYIIILYNSFYKNLFCFIESK